MDSFYNYIWDEFIKSFENSEALLEDTKGFTIADKITLMDLSSSKLDLWKKLFNNRKEYLKKKMTISFENKIHKIDNVEFHSKYGWVVSYKNRKAYLGKSSIYGDLKFTIGENSYFSGHSIIRGNGQIEIGNYCSIAFNQYYNVSNQNHPIHNAASIGLFNESRLVESRLFEYKPSNDKTEYKLKIGHDVWLGQRVTVFTNITIGNGAVIGAHSLVTKDCEPYGIYAGKPAKLIKYRFPKEIIEELLEIEWWHWNPLKMKNNAHFFSLNLNTFRGKLKDIIID